MKAGVRHRAIGEDVLDDELVLRVRVHRPQRMVFGERQALGLAVHRRRRAEHQAAHAVLGHCGEQRDRPTDVVLVVHDRLLDRLADRLPAGEMQHGLHALAREEGAERLPLAHVGAMEADIALRQLANALQHRRLGVAEVVDDHRPIARLGERDASVRADVAEAAGDQNCGLCQLRLDFTRAA